MSRVNHFEIHHGDCLDILPTLPDASVDLVLTDPPYGATENAWDTPVDLDRWWPEIERVAKPNAAILVFSQAPFDKALAMSRINRFRYEWVWEKGRATGFLNAKKAPLKAHEIILVFYGRQSHFEPQMEPAETLRSSTFRRAKPRSSNYGRQERESWWRETGMRYPRDVLRFSSGPQRKKLHPTEKPVDLCAYFIRTYCPPGGTVLDTFAGSGSTGVAAIREGRRFVGIEREAKYVEIAMNRLNETAQQLSLFGGAA